MKKSYLLVIVSIISVCSYAATITAVLSGGDWTNPLTWDLGRVPQAGDIVIIPAGITVNISSSIGASSTPIGNLYIKIYGTPAFVNNSKSSIYLDALGRIDVFTSGIIDFGGNAAARIYIFDPGKGTYTPYKGASNVNGPASLSSTGASPLRLLFSFFWLSHDLSNVLIQWSTASESNSKHFEIDRSTNSIAYATIAAVAAAGNSSMPLSYSYTDQKVSGGTTFYYRVKEVDLDNQLVYTGVKSIKLDHNSSDVKIVYASKNNFHVNFSQMVKGNVLMRLVSSSGQIIFQQTVSNPVGQVNIAVKNHSAGVYIFTISDGQGISISKKVLF
jgi:hypothetical protein